MERGLPFETGRSSEGELLVSFKAPLTFENAAEIWEGANTLIAKNDSGSFVLDLSGVTKVDSAGIALLRSFVRLCRRRGIGLRIQSVAPFHSAFSRLFRAQRPGACATRPSYGFPGDPLRRLSYRSGNRTKGIRRVLRLVFGRCGPLCAATRGGCAGGKSSIISNWPAPRP